MQKIKEPPNHNVKFFSLTWQVYHVGVLMPDKKKEVLACGQIYSWVVHQVEVGVGTFLTHQRRKFLRGHGSLSLEDLPSLNI